MPESKSRKTGQIGPKSKSAAQADRGQRRADLRAEKPEPGPLPTWYKAIMFGLMIVGLLWIITFYISESTLPVEAWGSLNILVGFGIAIIGFLMTTRWR